MATIYNPMGGGCAFSSECTATAANVLETKKAIYAGTDDDAALGSLPRTTVKTENGGLLSINSVLSF